MGFEMCTIKLYVRAICKCEIAVGNVELGLVCRYVQTNNGEATLKTVIEIVIWEWGHKGCNDVGCES